MKTYTSAAPMPKEIRQLSQAEKHDLILDLLNKAHDSKAEADAAVESEPEKQGDVGSRFRRTYPNKNRTR